MKWTLNSYKTVRKSIMRIIRFKNISMKVWWISQEWSSLRHQLISTTGIILVNMTFLKIHLINEPIWINKVILKILNYLRTNSILQDYSQVSIKRLKIRIINPSRIHKSSKAIIKIRMGSLIWVKATLIVNIRRRDIEFLFNY